MFNAGQTDASSARRIIARVTREFWPQLDDSRIMPDGKVKLKHRSRVETPLGRSELRYRRLFEAAQDGILMLDPQTRKITEANPFIAKLLGYSRAQLLNKELWQIGLLKDEPASRAAFRALKKNGFMRYDDLPLESKSGQLREVEFVSNLYAEGADEVIQCNVRDITKRKATEKALDQTRQLLARHTGQLEKLVVRRTAELTAKNRQLEAFANAARRSKEQYQRLFHESQAMQRKLRQLTRQIISAQEEERKKISRELHDEVVQMLVGINVELAALGQGAAAPFPPLRKKIARIQRLVENSVNAVHRFARELRPAVLDDLGVIPALLAYSKGLAERKKLKIHLIAFAGVEALASAKRTVLFRVAQEALTNVARHANATQVHLDITAIPGAVRMEIRDNGQSFPVEKILGAKNPKRLGLVGMRERIQMVGGRLAITSKPGHGTTVRAEIPLDRKKT